MLNLLPLPRTLTPLSGTFSLREQGAIVLEGADRAGMRPAADRLHAALQGAGWSWTRASAAEGPAIVLRLEPGAGAPAQGYALSILPDEVSLRAADPAGLFYGVGTLIQIIQQT